MSFVEGWRCDNCSAFEPGDHDTFGPEGWFIIVCVDANGSWKGEDESHLCPKCPPTAGVAEAETEADRDPYCDEIADLRERMTASVRALGLMRDQVDRDTPEWKRLSGKIEGLELVLDYTRAYRHN